MTLAESYLRQLYRVVCKQNKLERQYPRLMAQVRGLLGSYDLGQIKRRRLIQAEVANIEDCILHTLAVMEKDGYTFTTNAKAELHARLLSALGKTIAAIFTDWETTKEAENEAVRD